MRREQRANGDADGKTSMNRVLTFSTPPIDCVTIGASSDSVTAPASQNQETISVPVQMRWSRFVSAMRWRVEVQGLRAMTKVGAPSARPRESAEASQQASATVMISAQTTTGDWPPRGGPPGRDRADQHSQERARFHQRIAGGEFFGREQVGQQAVFDRPEQRGDDAVQPERTSET